MVEKVIAGRYRILRKLGAGSSGTVYLAQSVERDQQMAVKILYAETSSPEKSRAFRQEFALLSHLDHPSIVRIFDYGLTSDRRPYFVMEYVQGPPFDTTLMDRFDLMKKGDRAQFYSLIVDICLGLEHLHAYGLIHQDIKPDNILLRSSPAGRLRAELSDFGLAAAAGSGGLRHLAGTLEYFSPEAIRGARLDRRADLYSLGVTLYEILTGRNPFRSENPRQILRKHLEVKPAPLKSQQKYIPDTLERIIFRLLEKDPLDRLPTAVSVISTLCEEEGYVLSEAQRHAAGQLPPSQFVGRSRELARLESWQHIAQKGQPLLVLLKGVHGIGKTRLLREFSIHCQLQGTAVLDENWLNRFMPVRNQEVLRTGINAADYRNWELICRQISQFSCAPVLIIEDLEDVVPMVSDFLEYLLQRLTNQSILICCSYEPTKLDHRWKSRLKTLQRGKEKGSIRSLSLRPLSRGALSEMLRSRFHLLRDMEQLNDSIYRVSTGIPLYANILVSTLVDRSVLNYRSGQWSLSKEKLETAVLSEILKDIERPLAGRISTKVKKVLRVAALFGETFRPEDIVPLLSVDETALFRHLAEALRAGWLVKEPVSDEPETRYSFSKPGLRTSLYDSLSPRQRKNLHRRIAHHLEDRPEVRRNHSALAEHFGRSGIWGKTMHYSYIAAQEAMAASRPVMAVRLFERAFQAGKKLRRTKSLVPILEGQGDAYSLIGKFTEALQAYKHALRWLDRKRSQKRLELLLKKAILFRRQSRYDDALTTVEDGLALAGRGGFRLQRARLLAEKGWIQRMKADYQAAKNTLGQALKMLQWQRDRADTAKVLNSLGVVTWTLGRYEDSQAYYERSLGLYQELGDQDRIAALLDNLGLAHLAQGHLKRAVQHFQESLHLRKSTADVLHEAKACHNLAMAYAEGGQWEEATLYYQQSQTIKERIGDLDGLALTLNNLGIIYMHQGVWEEARRCQERALQIRLKLKDRYGLAGSFDNLGDLNRMMGRWKAADQYYRKARQIRRRIDDQLGLCYSQLNLGRLHLDQDHIRRSQEYLTSSWDCFQERGDSVGRMHADNALSELRLAQSDLEKARRHGERALSQAVRGGNRLAQALARRSLGLVEVFTGHEQQAEKLLLHCIEDCKVLQARYELAKTFFLLGLIRQKEGRTRQAIRSYREALMIFQKLGVKRYMSKIEKQLQKLQDTLDRQESSELFTLYTMSQILNSLRDVDVLLEKVLDLAIELLHAERGAVIFYKPEQDELEIKIARSMEKQTLSDAMEISRSTIKSVARGGKPVVVDNALQDRKYNQWQSVTMYNIMAILCVPLSIKGKVIGTIYLDNRTVQGIFSSRDVSFLESFSNLTALAIENARMYEELHGQNVYLKGELEKRYHYDNIVGNSEVMQSIFNIVDRVSPSKANVLILGESGTGKELVARLIHYSSPRKERPFLKVNCAALTESLLESELFGIEEKVATGVKSRKGKFELADGGTIFLDEIGDMSLSTQAKVLRVLQEREFERVGGSKTIHVDVRIISATNQDLQTAIAAKRFRKDLFYRLNTVAINIPPLRDRKEDIPFLVDHFIQKYCQENERDVVVVSSEVMDAFIDYHWPGNVRELENVVHRGVVMAEGKSFPAEYVPSVLEPEGRKLTLNLPAGQDHLADIVSLVERTLIEKALQEHGFVQLKAARSLGLSESALRYKMRKYGINK
jgi:Nif-specific regulatory protein